MGNDTPLAVLSNRRPLLYSYFKQLFAQVTNPPIDPIREAVVMSVASLVGSERNLLDETPEHARQLVIDNPILRDDELESLRQVDSDVFKAHTLDITWPATTERRARAALERLCADADRALADGTNILDPLRPRRRADARADPVAARRRRGPPPPRPRRDAPAGGPGRRVRRAARGPARRLLIGYGAAAVNPYLMLGDDRRARRRGQARLLAIGGPGACIKAIGKGLLKVISKMGISTISSYCGAQVFEAVGLATSSSSGTSPARRRASAASASRRSQRERSPAMPARFPAPSAICCRSSGCMPGAATASTTSGTQRRSRCSSTPCAAGATDVRRVRRHRERRFGATLDAARPVALPRRDDGGIPLEEVEPAAEIVKRFSTGAMSLGSLSREAHETLAVAMNRIGGRSNTGEGGEDPVRFTDERRSKIKQVASGRFGVNIDYLTNADELQIKMAQGAKPGEGGQLPGHKVDRYIAGVRLTTPGSG